MADTTLSLEPRRRAEKRGEHMGMPSVSMFLCLSSRFVASSIATVIFPGIHDLET